MAGAAHDALLDVPGVRADLQHFQIVIRFQDQEIGFAQVMLHQLRHVAEVGDDGDFFAVGAKGVADRVGGIMRNGERGDFDIADYELDSGADVLTTRSILVFGPSLVHLADFAVRRLGQVGRAFPIARQLRETVRVIAVFVGDQDAVNVFGARAAESFEAPQHFFLCRGRRQSGEWCTPIRATCNCPCCPTPEWIHETRCASPQCRRIAHDRKG